MDVEPGPLTGDIAADKAAWRRAIRRNRRSRLEAEGPTRRARDKETLSTHITSWLMKYAKGRSPVSGEGWHIASFESLPTEPPMSQTNESLQSIVVNGFGCEVWLPITLADGVLRWRSATLGASANPLQADPQHLAQSVGTELLAKIDVIIVPALALSRPGRRLGQGGGYYDRAIPALLRDQPRAQTLGVSYPDEVLANVPAEDHDIAVDWLVDRDGVIPAN
ncbi:hypothetical protein K0651_02945 [Ornithinimicrobium sp. Arc0846-15]|nr:hypothetical protein [Ornithinimicrobium laminariae]